MWPSTSNPLYPPFPFPVPTGQSPQFPTHLALSRHSAFAEAFILFWGCPYLLIFYLKPFHPWGGTDCWITQAFFTSTPLIRQSWVWLFIFFKSLLINFFNYLYHVFLCLDICFSCPAFLGQHVYWRERPKWVPSKKSGHD